MDSPNSDCLLSPNSGADAEIRRLTQLLEDSRQEAYMLRSRLQVAEKCSLDYVAELEALHQDALEKDIHQAAAIRGIEEERSSALRDAEEKIENWQAEYQQMVDKAAGLEKELLAKSVHSADLSRETNETAALQHELEEALDALTTLTAACKQHKELISVLQTEKKALAQRVESLEQDVDLYKEHLNIAKEQLFSKTEEFKELQEHVAVIESELSALKATPNVQSRGNSLFAEVEDNRQQMVKQFKMMLAKFNQMKNDFSAKCSEIVKLKKEKSILLDRLEIAERKAKEHYKGFVENYEIRIQELLKTVNDLKNDVRPVYINGNPEILKFAEHMVSNSRKEVESLREEMELRSALRLNEAAELLKARGELAQARTDLRKYSLKVIDLSAALEQRGATNLTTLPPEPVSSQDNSLTVESPAKNIPAENKVGALRKVPDVLFDEELLHDKFKVKKQMKDNINFEESMVYQVSTDSCDPHSSKYKARTQLNDSDPRIQTELEIVSEDLVDSRTSKDARDSSCREVHESEKIVGYEDSLGYVEEPKTGEISGTPNLADELGFDLKVGHNSDADEQNCTLANTNDTSRTVIGAVSFGEECGNRSGRLLDSVSYPDNKLPADLAESPTSSQYFSPDSEERMLQSLRHPLSPTENLHPVKALLDSSSFKSSAVIGMSGNVVSTKDLKDSSLRSSNAASLVAGSLTNAKHSVDAARPAEDKENTLGNASEEEVNKPVRRRPRPNKQTHPIIYMT